MKLIFFDRSHLIRHAPHIAPAVDVTAILNAHPSFKDGTPLFLSEDGGPVTIWFEFGTHLGASWQGSTLRQYSYAILRFANYLQSLDLDLVQVTEGNLADYRDSRTVNSPNPISAISWRAESAPLRILFSYLVSINILSRLPWITHGNRDVLNPPIRSQANPKNLTEDEWLMFLRVGLRGRLPNGNSDLAFTGRTAMRNAVGAQIALTTGMRLQEFHSLLRSELRADDGDNSGVHVTLQACAKGGRERTVYLPAWVRAQADLYAATERQALLPKIQSLKKKGLDCLFIVDQEDAHGLWVSGVLNGKRTRRNVKAMDPQLRRRTFRETDSGYEPLTLFVNSHGRMPSKDSWHRSFREASKRMTEVIGSRRSTRKVTAHMLRHTFAVTMLRELSKLVGRAGRPSLDPIVEVQRMLGHASLATTSIYLTTQNDLASEVEEVFASWTDDSKDYGSLIDRYLHAETENEGESE